MLIRRGGVDLAGLTHITATVRSMAGVERSWTGWFRVDRSVVDCLVPRPVLEGVGLEVVGQRLYESADGGVEIVDATTASVEVMGEVVGATVLVGDDDGEAVLGMTALESLGIGAGWLMCD